MNTRHTRCLVVDDEPHALEIIKAHIAAVPSLELSGECLNAVTAFDFLQKNPVDLIFLDIQMPQMLGTNLVKSLPHPPNIIFTTAHRDYALEGFELGVVDFLLKPISFDRFLKAVYKITLSNFKPEPNLSEQASERFLYFRTGRKMVKVMLSEILYIESLKDYVKIVTTRTQVITKQGISSVHEMLPEDEFLRIHRSFIVSLKKIDSFTSTDITIGKAELPVGPLYRHEFMKIQVRS